MKLEYNPDKGTIYDGRGAVSGEERELVDLAYHILREHQTMDQVMNRLQSDLDDDIEREHRITTEG